MAKLLGIDIGTSGTKVILIDETGKVLAQASAEYPLSTPKPLWAEQDPAHWWKATLSCIAKIGEPNPDAIGLSGQMHGAVFLDASDQVIRPTILWNDQRTAAECADIDAAVGPERVKQITGNPPLTGFQAPKLLWLRKHEPEAYARLNSLLLPKDYVRFLLSGVKAGEVSDGAGTGLFDITERAWSEEMLEKLEVPRSLLPEVAESDVPTSKTKGVPGLADGIPIVGGGGDQAAGAVGTGAVRPGIVSVSLGTSGVVFSAIESPGADPTGAAHVFCHANRSWHAMGVMLMCGGALRWARDAWFPGLSYDALAGLAGDAPEGAAGLTFLPYLSGERTPHNDPTAQGALAGLTLMHGREHLARAVFEGLSFGLVDCFARLQALGAVSDEMRVTGGGAKSAFWLQMLADLFGKPCATLEADEGPGFGAAILAGVGIGLWPNVAEACRQTVRIKAAVEPQPKDYSQAYARYQELYPALKPWFGR